MDSIYLVASTSDSEVGYLRISDGETNLFDSRYVTLRLRCRICKISVSDWLEGSEWWEGC